MIRPSLVSSLLWSLVLLGTVPAQESGPRPAPPTPAVPKEAAEVRLPHPADVHKPLIIEPGEYECWTLLDQVGDCLRRSYVLGESFEKSRPVAPMVIRFPLRVDEPDLEAFAGQLLVYAGCFAVPVQESDRSSVWRVLRFDGSRRTEYIESARFLEPERVLAMGDDPRPVSTAFAMHNGSSYAFANDMRSMFQMNGGSNQIVIASSQSTNLVMILGPANRVASVLRLAQRYEANADHVDPSMMESRVRQLEARIAALEARLPPAEQGGKNKQRD